MKKNDKIIKFRRDYSIPIEIIEDGKSKLFWASQEFINCVHESVKFKILSEEELEKYIDDMEEEM